jgi:peptidoglycan/LPS O-acetylase OafA/YrhL
MPRRLQGLTILRLFAALWVVLFHLQDRVPFLAPDAWPRNFVAHGAFAMSLFFILSGVVLTVGYPRLPDAAAIRQFYLARFARIYPTYAIVHLLALAWFAPATVGWLKWAYINLLSALGLQAWVPHTFAEPGINGGTWTISVELFFYALFPALLPALRWCHGRIGGLRLGLALVLLSGLIGLAESVFQRVGGTAIYYILPLHRLPEFMLGVVLGLGLAQDRPARVPPLANLGGALVAFLVVCANPLHLMPQFWMRYSILVVPVIAWLLHASARAEQHYRPDWRAGLARLMIYLGESSYCLFLAHLLPLAAFQSAAGTAWLARVNAAGGAPALVLLLVLLSLALAIVLHELVEKPARRYLLRRWGQA